jgi:hypothetical protein
LKKYLFFFFLFTYYATHAQHIKGRVLDQEVRLGLPGAIIKVFETGAHVLSDENGYFKITNLKPGRYNLECSYVGYERRLAKDLLLTAGKDLVLDLNLEESITELGGLEIRATNTEIQNEMAAVSAKTLSVEQSSRYAASWGDPARMAASLAGVSSQNDQTNEIIVRGNSPLGLLWRIEGVEVPNPNHFSNDGASGGGYSAISTQILGNTQFYLGAFPAEFGNASSGVFDVQLRKGNDEKREMGIQLGVQGLEASWEGPFLKHKKSSFLVNYRLFTVGILSKLGFKPAGNNLIPFFQDAAFKLVFPFKKDVIKIWGIGGKSDGNIIESPTSKITDVSNFIASGLGWSRNLNEKSFLESSFSFSGNLIDNSRISSSNIRTNLNTYSYFRLQSSLNHKINKKVSIKTGFYLNQTFFKLLDKTKTGTSTSQRYNKNGSAFSSQYFTQIKYKIGTRVSIMPGLHLHAWHLRPEYSFEPRLGFTAQLRPKVSLNAGFGLHSKSLPLTMVFARNESNGKVNFENKDLKLPKSYQYILGLKHSPRSDFEYGAEIYFIRHSDHAIYSLKSNVISANNTYSSLNDLESSVNIPLLSEGLGRNKGIDFSFNKNLNHGWYAIYNQSFYKAEYQGQDRVWRPARFSNRYISNVLWGKENKVGPNNLFGTNAKLTWAGGIRTSPTLLEASIKAGSQVLNFSQRWEEILKDYFRLDAKIYFVRNKAKHSSTFSLDLGNISNRKNQRRELYNHSTKSLSYAYMLGFIPVLNYKLEI